jgi:hypothetical protein
MTVNPKNGGRARAWILVQVESPHHAAQVLYDNLCDQGDNKYVVIRADVVDYVYNLMIPVDAESVSVLQYVHQRILELTGATCTAIIPVVEHTPFPPHDAQGYIRRGEVAAGHNKKLRPGRQHSSPGENPWG